MSSLYITDIIDIHKYLDGVPWSEHCIHLSKHNSITEQQPLFCIVTYFFCLIKYHHGKLVYNMLGYYEHTVRYPLMDGIVIHSDSIVSLIKKMKRHKKFRN